MMKKQTIMVALMVSLAMTAATAQDKTNTVLGSPSETYRADDVPAGDAGRYYIPGAAAGKDNIMPSSYSSRFKLGAHLKAGYNLSCGNMNFYSNIKQEIARLRYKLKNTVKKAQQAILTSISAAITNFFQYQLMKINPTLGQLSLKQLDEYIELFELNIKQCKDYERDVKNGKNPLSEIVQIAVGDQWKRTIGLVNSGDIALEEAEEEMVKEAKKNGVTMADGKQYGGEGQDPINITKSLIEAGMNLVLARPSKNAWGSDFNTSKASLQNNPILKEFKNTKQLYEFVEDIYGSTKSVITDDTSTGERVTAVAGRGYELKYVDYRNKYLPILRQYVDREIDRQSFESQTGQIIPPAEIDDVRQMLPYERAVEIEQRSQQYAIKRMRDNLIFAKQALKTGIYAPDLQQSGMKAPAEREYKSIYYRILDDISEISRRAYQY